MGNLLRLDLAYSDRRSGNVALELVKTIGGTGDAPMAIALVYSYK